MSDMVWVQFETVLVSSFVLTWGIGLAPPVLIRYVVLRKSMKWGWAIGLTALFWIINLNAFIALGSESKKHGALILVAMVSYAILRHGTKKQTMRKVIDKSVVNHAKKHRSGFLSYPKVVLIGAVFSLIALALGVVENQSSLEKEYARQQEQIVKDKTAEARYLEALKTYPTDLEEWEAARGNEKEYYHKIKKEHEIGNKYGKFSWSLNRVIIEEKLGAKDSKTYSESDYKETWLILRPNKPRRVQQVGVGGVYRWSGVNLSKSDLKVSKSVLSVLPYAIAFFGLTVAWLIAVKIHLNIENQGWRRFLLVSSMLISITGSILIMNKVLDFGYNKELNAVIFIVLAYPVLMFGLLFLISTYRWILSGFSSSKTIIRI